MGARTLELQEELTTKGSTQRVRYSFFIRDQKPSAFAMAVAYCLEDHYLLSGPEGELDINVSWSEYPNKSRVFGVEHDFGKAKSRLYKRVRSQARRIATREGLELEVIRDA